MSAVTRRDVLRLGAGGGAALAAIVVGAGTGARPAEAGGLLETLDVLPTLSTFDALRSPAEGAAVPTGPFHVEGGIYRQNSLDAAGALRAGADWLIVTGLLFILVGLLSWLGVRLPMWGYGLASLLAGSSGVVIRAAPWG